MMIHQLWAEEVRLSLFGQKVGKTTPQHNLRQQSWIEVRAGRGERWQARTGDWWSIRCPQPIQRCSTLGIVINYTRNVSSQPWSLVSSKLSDWWVNLAILITYQSWNISSQQQPILLLSAEILILTPAAGRDDYVERNHRIRGIIRPSKVHQILFSHHGHNHCVTRVSGSHS